MPRDTPGRSRCQYLTLKLIREVGKGSIAHVTAVLAEGASVDGTMELRPIVMAARRQNLEMIKLLIKHGADVNAPSRQGSQASEFHLTFTGARALDIAAGVGRIDIMRVLLQAGADPNAVNTDGFAPLMAVCGVPGDVRAAMSASTKYANMIKVAGLDETGDLWVKIGRELLKAGADPLTTARDGLLTLHAAAIEGNADLISVMLSVAPHTINQTTEQRETALYLAARHGHATAVDRLLSAGATHPIDPENEMCPIAVAAFLGHDEVLRVLIEKGSDTVEGLVLHLPVVVATAVAQGRSGILHRVLTAAREGEDRQLQLHRYSGLAGPLLHYAAGFGVPVSVRFLLAEGANESAID